MALAGLDKLPTARGVEILASQYAESWNLKSINNIVLKQFDELHAASSRLLSTRSLNSARGITLDHIGVLVGQPRGYTRSVAQDFFGFEGSVGSGTFGTNGDDAVGKRFLSASDQEYNLTLQDDDTYLRFIKARIIRNKSKLIIDDLIDIVLLGLDHIDDVTITASNGHLDYYFDTVLSDVDILLLLEEGFIPKAVGISFSITDQKGQIN